MLNSPMFSIPIGGVDVVLGVQWLQSLGTIAFNFQELFMKFYVEVKEVELRVIAGKLGKIISSNKASKERTTRHNCTIMFTRGSHIEIIYFSISPKILGQSFQGI